jgi:uncharacterized protein (TIGR02145 family)
MNTLKILLLFLLFCNISYPAYGDFHNTNAFNPFITDRTDDSKMNIYVVIVGVGKYNNKNNLKYTKDDAYKVGMFYKSPEGGSIPDENMSLLLDQDATRENVLNSMNTLFSKAQSNDMIIFYFSGHGSKSAFLLCNFTGDENVLEHKEIKEIFQNSKAKYKVCIADACYSGNLKKKKDANNSDEYYDSFDNVKGGFALFMSSSEVEVSIEPDGKRQGVFSYYLIKGLKGSANINGDSKVTIKELYNYVKKEVSEYTAEGQNPVLNGDYDENMPMSVLNNISIPSVIIPVPIIDNNANSGVTDYDGNKYKIVTIIKQVWMSENLNVEHYRNGDVIPQVQDKEKWANLTSGAWCYYDNDSKNGKIYGKLYNWYAVNDPRGLSPKGWHIPSDAEWTQITDYLGGDETAGSVMKATILWNSPNTGATNESGFTAFPGGVRNYDGTYDVIGKYGYFWSASEDYNRYAWYRYLSYDDSDVDRTNYYKKNGFSVRCVRD